VASTTFTRSLDNVVKLRSSSLSVTVSPCPRASMDRIPAEEIIFRISEARQAKDRPEEPAPWWVMKRAPPEVGGVRYAEYVVVGELRDGRWRC